MRPGFCSVARTCAPAVLVRRQGKARSGIESWAGRYPQAADHRRDGARELGKPQASRAGFMAGSDLARKPRMLVAIALANKMARKIWAMLTKQEEYRDPVVAVAA